MNMKIVFQLLPYYTHTLSCIKKFEKWSQLFAIPSYGGLVQIHSQSTKVISKQNKMLRQHCITITWKFSCGYSQSINKQNILAKMVLLSHGCLVADIHKALKSLTSKTVEQSHYM